MKTRLDYTAIATDIVRSIYGAHAPLKNSTLGEDLIELCNLRASQINGCAFCVDLHSRTLRAAGVDTAKVDLVAVWREAPGFDERERAALGWTEALTLLPQSGANDAVYEPITTVFTPREQVELTHAIALINLWNRFAVGFRATPGGKTKAELVAGSK